MLFGVILLFSCKKEEIEPLHPIEDNEIDLPVLYVEKGSDIIIDHDIYIDSAILFIDEGVNMRFKNGARIIVGDNWPATILAIGKEDNPINFIPYSDGSQEDEYWGGIQILSSSKYISTFDHCNFIKGCDDDNDAILYQERGYISIKNCLFDYSKKYGVYISSDSHIEDFTNNVIKHTFEHPLVISTLLVHKIGDNNLFLTDKKNKGILLGSLGSKDDELQVSSEDDDTIVWKAQTVPYILKDELVFGNGNVKICEGTTIAMDFTNNNIRARIVVDCDYFEAIGTLEKPVIFTSNRINKKAGDWRNVFVSSNAVFKNCIFEYGGDKKYNINDAFLMTVKNNEGIIIDSCIFRYAENGVRLDNNDKVYPEIHGFDHNTFSEIGKFAISIFLQSLVNIGTNNAFNGNVVKVNGSDIKNKSVFWKNINVDYYCDDFLGIIGSNSKLEIEKGTTIKFNGGGIKIGGNLNGRLICNGTAEEPIILTSSKDNPLRGDWSGIYFYTNSSGSVLNHCEILYAGEIGDFYKASIKILDNVTIKNCTIAHSANWGLIYSLNANPVIENNTFFDNFSGNILGMGN